MKENHYNMIIVGAGLSGLTAGAYLSKAGYSVLVLEKTSHCGGLLNSFSRDGYVFDAGARSIENSGIIKPMLKELGIEMEMSKSLVSIGVESSVVAMEDRESITSYQKVLENLYPESVEDVRKIFRIIKRVYKKMAVIYGFDNPVFKNFREDKRYLFKELLPWMVRFIPAVRSMEKMGQPIETYLETLTANQSINDIIAQHFFKKTPASFALGYFYVYQDYLYPKGGTGMLSTSLKRCAIEHGATVQVDTEVVKVVIDEHQVIDSTGKSYKYDKLLWCADSKTLYRNLDTSHVERPLLSSIEKQAEKVFASRGGDSVFTLFLGVEKDPKEFAKKTSAHLFYTPSRQGLGQTHLSQLQKILDQGMGASKEAILLWVETYCALTTYEISIPSLRDETLSPLGETGLVISFLLEYDLVRLVSDQGWYEQFKEHIEDQMIKTLKETVFSGLLDEIELQFSASPLSLERIFGSSEGGITGWTFEQKSPAVSNLLKIASSIQTPIPDILQCGQWAYSPAGIPTAILTGWYAYDALTRKK